MDYYLYKTTDGKVIDKEKVTVSFLPTSMRITNKHNQVSYIEYKDITNITKVGYVYCGYMANDYSDKLFIRRCKKHRRQLIRQLKEEIKYTKSKIKQLNFIKL